jgi:hypothetical protein
MEEPRHPVSGIDYPGTFQDFDKWFSSENACLEYIAKLRWPQGFICPGCAENADKPSFLMNLRSDLTGAHPRPEAYSSTV